MDYRLGGAYPQIVADDVTDNTLAFVWEKKVVQCR